MDDSYVVEKSVNTHLNISNQELRWSFYWCLCVNDLLDGTGPVHSLIEVLGVQPVAVLSPIYCDVPEAWKHSSSFR